MKLGGFWRGLRAHDQPRATCGQCEKCGARNISGPRYCVGAMPTGEALAYTCLRCGYRWTTPTIASGNAA